MTNLEKYMNKIIKEIERSDVTNITCNIREVATKEHDFDCMERSCTKCAIEIVHWLAEEYKEPSHYEDWEIDDPIEVSVNGKNWYKRHFAGTDKFGDPLAWDKGVTSWSAEDNTTKVYWEYARKVEE